MAYNPVLPITYSDASYLSGDELQSDLAVLIGNDIDLNSRINSIAGGYNQIDLDYTGASLTYSGSTYVSGKPVFLAASAVTVTGAAGWRYIVCTDAGVISIETIPGGEITANTEQYTPEPIYNSTYNGYYSSVNTAKRIIGICYFDSTNILEVIAYGNGKKKNDCYWSTFASGVTVNSVADRLQFTSTWERSRGTDFSIVDYGAGTADAEGLHFEANTDCTVAVRVTLNTSGTQITVSRRYIPANGTPTGIFVTSNVSGGSTSQISTNTYICRMRKGDYMVFYVSTSSGGAADFQGIEAAVI